MRNHITEYKGDPMEYAHDLLDSADKLYDQHKDTIDAAKGHLKLESDHLAARAAIGDRHAHYFPELLPAIRSRSANIFDVFTSAAPPLKLTPTNADAPGSRDSVNRLERWLNACYDTKHIWLDWYLAFLSAEMFPYGVVYLRWEDSWGRVPYVNQIGGISYEDLITFSGPVLELISTEDYRGDLYARSKKDMRFHFMTKEVDEGYLKRGHKNGDYPYFNPNELEKAKSGNWMDKRRSERFNADYQKPKGYDYELVTSWIKVFNEQEEDTQWREVVFCGDMLLSERPAPLGELGSPFFILNSFPLPGEIAGLSTAILGEANQNAMNEFWNQAIEANEQALWSPTLFEGDVTSEPVWEPMALWEVEHPESFRKLNEPRMSGDLLATIQFLKEHDQAMLAAYDVIQPVTTGSKQTAREYMGKREQYSKVMGVNLQFYAAEVMSVNKRIIAMAREHMADWVQIGLLGGDPALTNLTIPDLAVDVSIEIPNVRQLSMEEMEMTKWDVMYDKMIGNPIVAMNPAHLHELTKRYLIAHKEKDVSKLIGESQEGMQQPGMMMPPQGLQPGGM